MIPDDLGVCKRISAHWPSAPAEKVGVPVIVDIKLARSLSNPRRYDLVSLEEIDEVLRLLVWLEEVENAGKDALFSHKKTRYQVLSRVKQ